MNIDLMKRSGDIVNGMFVRFSKALVSGEV